MQNKPRRNYQYEDRILWNTALPLVESSRTKDFLRNNLRASLFDSLSFYTLENGAVVRKDTKGGRSVRGLNSEMAEMLLSKIGVKSYEKVIENLFKKGYISARKAKNAIKYCSTVNNEVITDNEINLLIKKWIEL